MSKSNQEDLDLLLSLQDRVLETPPASPSHCRSPSSPGYLSDDGMPKRREQVDMSVFRNAVEDCLDCKPEPAKGSGNLNRSSTAAEPDVEKFSGLRIRNLLVGDTLSGCWATVAVLTEVGSPRTSSAGKNYCIWKIGSLSEDAISLFLFGDAYQRNSDEKVGAIFALFNCNVRKDSTGGFSLSVFSPSQILKIGTSADYGVCKGKRKDGIACTLVINKRRGIYCRYHKSKASEKYSSTRTELIGGNIRTAFRNHLQAEGIYVVDRLSDRTNVKKATQPVKLLSVEGLKRALSGAGKVTTNTHSQGIRFLSEVTAKMEPRSSNKESSLKSEPLASNDKRKSSAVKVDPSLVQGNERRGVKRSKTEEDSANRTKPATGKLIELEIFSSDDEM
ncbi:protein MCM10 homolog isoform X2 [Rhodamnia argentea]|uniref:Protein MCM10 homolog isoform X2 n=1 Tax=Rhodamnia argentea TaxID=178133 RepID=A0A8B8NMX3_9MYRT|nr:protein MCM10 homolog isoform X2 [Rhodamnia argentea]